VFVAELTSSLGASSSEAAVIQLSTHHFNEFLDPRYQSPTRDSIKNLAVYTRVRESCYNYGSPDYGMIPTLQALAGASSISTSGQVSPTRPQLLFPRLFNGFFVDIDLGSQFQYL
jgi:hypothetical protein